MAGRTYSLALLLEDSMGNSIQAEDSDGVLSVAIVGQDGPSVWISDLDPNKKRQAVLSSTEIQD